MGVKNANGLNPLQQMIASILGDINSNWSNPAIAQRIAADIKFDQVTQSFKYEPQKNKSIIQYQTSGGFPQTPWKDKYKGGDSGYHYGSTVVNYGEKVLAILKEEKYKEISKQEQKFIEAYNRGIENLDKKRKTNNQNLKDNSYQEVIHKVKLKIDEIKAQFASIAEIERQINAAFAEILGNIIEQKANSIVFPSLQQALQNALSVGRTQTIQTKNPKIIKLSFKDASIEFNEKGEKASIFKQTKETGQTVFKDGQNKVFWEYEMKELGQSRDQKSDVEITLGGEKQGLSVKNINLDQNFYKDKEGKMQPYRIGVQDSSLMLYLLGIEQQQAKMGTHYLNILAKHEENDDNEEGYNEARQQANKALSLYILYSALTGRGQLRQIKTSTGFANIFAVHDKGNAKLNGTPVHRVRFYDIGAIIKDVMQNDIDAINPQISTIKLANAKEPADKDPMAPSRRITKLLIDARKKTVAINLSHIRLNTLNDGSIKI